MIGHNTRGTLTRSGPIYGGPDSIAYEHDAVGALPAVYTLADAAAHQSPVLVAADATDPSWAAAEDLYFAPLGSATCLIAVINPQDATSAAQCVLTRQLLAEALGHVAYASVLTIADLRVENGVAAFGFTYPQSPTSTASWEQIGLLSGEELESLPATRVNPVDELDSQPDIDPVASEVTYERNPVRNGLLQAGQVLAVDVQTGTHLATVVGSGVNAGSSSITTQDPDLNTGDSGAGYTALPTPQRILDTRAALGGHRAPLGAGATLEVSPSAAGVPTDASAVLLSVTATGATKSTYLQAYDEHATVPTTSLLNLSPGEAVAAPATVFLPGLGDSVRIRNAVGSVNVIVDVVGYYEPVPPGGSGQGGSLLDLVSPSSRLLDTRATRDPLGPGEVHTLDVVSDAHLPATTTAVVVNLTAVAPSATTYLTAYDADQLRPAVSSLTVNRGATRSVLSTVGVGPTGAIDIANAVGTANVLVDVVGYYTSDQDAGLLLFPASGRVFDTRDGTNEVGGIGTLAANSSTALRMSGVMTLPTGTVALPTAASRPVALLSITADGPTGTTYLSAYPTGTARPNTSVLNAVRGETVAGATLAQASASGEVTIYNSAGTTRAFADVEGYFAEN